MSTLPREVRHAHDGPVPLWLPACGPLGLRQSSARLSLPATDGVMVGGLCPSRGSRMESVLAQPPSAWRWWGRVGTRCPPILPPERCLPVTRWRAHYSDRNLFLGEESPDQLVLEAVCLLALGCSVAPVPVSKVTLLSSLASLRWIRMGPASWSHHKEQG